MSGPPAAPRAHFVGTNNVLARFSSRRFTRAKTNCVCQATQLSPPSQSQSQPPAPPKLIFRRNRTNGGDTCNFGEYRREISSFKGFPLLPKAEETSPSLTLVWPHEIKVNINGFLRLRVPMRRPLLPLRSPSLPPPLPLPLLHVPLK